MPGNGINKAGKTKKAKQNTYNVETANVIRKTTASGVCLMFFTFDAMNCKTLRICMVAKPNTKPKCITPTMAKIDVYNFPKFVTGAKLP